jgi:hypothetical protein
MKFAILKPLAATGLFSIVVVASGCSNSGLHTDVLGPPGYTASENATRQLRYAGFDFEQAIDDFDKNVTMTRPGSMLTTWNISRND